VKTESEITPLIWLVVLALTAISLLSAFFFDASVVSWVSSYTSAHLKHSAALMSRVGDWPAHVALAVIGAAVALFVGRRDWLRIFLAMLIACALAGIAARVIKIAAGRARPTVRTETMWNGLRFHDRYNAFPSGHTASSTAFFASLALARRKVGAPLLLIPALIGAARIFAGAHYLSDVTFAAALGVACALLTWRFLPLKLSTSRQGESGSDLNHPGCQPRHTS
jgi:membrane-associated phospholipid phosphatase